MNDIDLIALAVFMILVISVISAPLVIYCVFRAGLAIIHILEGIARTYT